METQYTFTKVINSDRLVSEINTAGLSSALTRVETLAPDQLYIYFNPALSAPDLVTLNALVAAHDPTPTVVSTASDSSPATYSYIANGTTVTVPANRVLPLFTSLDIDGALIIDGRVEEV